MTPVLLGGLAGIVFALLAQGPIRRLPLGIEERRAQPGWTGRATHPLVVVPVAGGIGAVLGAAVAPGGAIALAFLLLAIAIPATVIDVRWRVVPDTLVVVGSAMALAILALTAPALLVSHTVIAGVAGLIIGVLAIASRGALGFGDAKLIAVFGLILGWALPLALLAGTLFAGVAAPVVMALRGRRATVPLVPFLVAGALVVTALGGRVPPYG